MLDTIVVGAGPSRTTREVVEVASELARVTGSHVHVVAAYRPRAERRVAVSAEAGETTLVAGADAAVERILSDMASVIGSHGAPVETHAREGDPAEAILQVAEEHGANLIVVGNRGMGGAGRLLLDDVPHKISHVAPCSVLLVRTTDPTDRQTVLLAGAAAAALSAVAAGELTRVRSREAVEVAVAGYRTASQRESALLNMLLAFVVTFCATRLNTVLLRRRSRLAFVPEVRTERRHVHHFVPGIGLAFTAGGLATITHGGRLARWLAVPFGVGAALTLDESALLLELADVYWEEEGVLSIQVTLAATSVLAVMMLALRLLRRGERRVFPLRRVLPLLRYAR
jgi:nucleotide-binding universal stress UspA family protein